MIYITVLLFTKEGKEVTFQEYENAVLPILKDYNGILIHRIKPNTKNYIGESTEEQPSEIHLISFPSDKDFNNYLQDSKRASFNNLKEESLKMSYVYKGIKL